MKSRLSPSDVLNQIFIQLLKQRLFTFSVLNTQNAWKQFGRGLEPPYVLFVGYCTDKIIKIVDHSKTTGFYKNIMQKSSQITQSSLYLFNYNK